MQIASHYRRTAGACAGVLALLGACSWLALTGTSTAFEKAALGAPVAAEQVIQFNIYLPVRDRAAVDSLIAELQTPGSPAYHKWLTPAQFNEQFGPSPSLVSAIMHELATYGLQVNQVHAHSLVVSGTVGAINAAFGTTLVTAHFASGKQGLAAATPLKLTPVLRRPTPWLRRSPARLTCTPTARGAFSAILRTANRPLAGTGSMI